MTIDSTQMITRAEKETIILGWITVPYTDPKDPTKFASATSNPPGIHTEYPSIVFRNYGNGKVIYSAGPLETMKKDDQRTVFINTINKLTKKAYAFSDA